MLQNELEDRLKAMTEHAEMHAYSVRQLIAQRSRMFKLLELVSTFPNLDIVGLQALLGAIERSKSQVLQDILALAINKAARDGFFVEFGACDGVLISNTFLLEKEFGWTGILSEPAKDWQASLKENRRCAIDERCVWSETGSQVEFAEYAKDGYFTESSVLKDEPAGEVVRTYKVETVSLVDLLRQHKAPKRIGLISIDVEGGEYEILKSFPFDEFTFEMACIEHHVDDEEVRIKNLLESHGYRQILRSISDFDGFYVPGNSDVLPYVGEVTPIGVLSSKRPHHDPSA